MKAFSLFVLLVGFFVLDAVPANAARVDILPRKILLDDRQRSGDLTILNMGQEQNHVRIELISYRQKPDGAYEELTGPLNPAFDPENVVRLSPRQFVLPPNGRQKVRFTIQNMADLPDGEYRFHVKAVSFDDADFSVRRTPERGSTMAFKMNVAVAIPVIIRKGQIAAEAKIENVNYTAATQSSYNAPTLTFDIKRTGQAGVMGTVRALQQQDGSSEYKEIGIVSNLNVFSEVETRRVEMPLNEVPSSGPIKLVYTDDFGKKAILDEIVLQK